MNVASGSGCAGYVTRVRRVAHPRFEGPRAGAGSARGGEAGGK